jgi:hypothetical protein
MMNEKLLRDVRFLKAYSTAITVLLLVLVAVAANQAQQKPKFEEIDVERINIVEKDGKLKMVIANSERQHPGIVDGQSLPRKRPAGVLFFNTQGDECGGLSYDGRQQDGKVSAGALLAFDRFRQDQTVGVQYGEANGRYFAGLFVWDRPDKSLGPLIEKLAAIEKMPDGPEKTAALKELRQTPGGAERVMVGRDRDQSAVVRLDDANGQPRIRLSVNAAGVPRLEFLDKSGKVTYSLPPEDGAVKEKKLPGVTGTLKFHEQFPSEFVAARKISVWLPPSYDQRAGELFGTETLDAGYEPYQKQMDAILVAAGYSHGEN